MKLQSESKAITQQVGGPSYRRCKWFTLEAVTIRCQYLIFQFVQE